MVLLLLTNCQRSQLVKTHGMSFLEKRQKNLIINQTNKNDALKKINEVIIIRTIGSVLEKEKTIGS